MGSVRAWLLWWVVLAAFSMVLADDAAVAELVVAAIAASVGATAAVLVRRERPFLLRPRARWLLAAWRPLLALFTDLVPLTRALVLQGVLRRPPTGRLVEVPLAAAGDTPEDVTYRAFTQVLGSLGPNTIVVDTDERRGVVLAHQLVPERDPARSATPVPPP
jgi:multisubunit Na+/H+ antiporter MnhE subunit